MSERLRIRSDRELQDTLITYLADANLRRTSAPSLPLSSEQANRAGKFARFLARRYYRDRLARSFRYSRRFGPAAETLVETPAFDAFLDDCALGSLPAAERVAELAAHYVSGFPAPGPWWNELLEYERLFFLQAATTENAIPGSYPKPGTSARCHRFSWNLPALVALPKSGQPAGDDLRREITLLFSRTSHGRVYVVEVDATTAAVFHAVDGRHSLAQVAEAVSLPIAVVQPTLTALAQIGALLTSSVQVASSEQ